MNRPPRRPTGMNRIDQAGPYERPTLPPSAVDAETLASDLGPDGIIDMLNASEQGSRDEARLLLALELV